MMLSDIWLVLFDLAYTLITFIPNRPLLTQPASDVFSYRYVDLLLQLYEGDIFYNMIYIKTIQTLNYFIQVSH